MSFRSLWLFGFAFLVTCSLAPACDRCGSPGVCVRTECCSTDSCVPRHHHSILPSLFKKRACSDCEVHVHYVKSCDSSDKNEPAAATAGNNNRAAANSGQQLMYSQVMPASAGMGMPMMMPMMMPYAMPMMGMQSPSAPRTPTTNAGCAECMPRVERLEKGVQVLAERMDKIESILENQTAALVAMTESLKNDSVEE